MVRTCVNCKKKFEIAKSEIDFYKSKGLELPKRCKECRDKNRQIKERKKAEERKRLIITLLLFFVETAALVTAIVLFNKSIWGGFYAACAVCAAIFAVYMVVTKSKKAALSDVELYSVMNHFRYRFKDADDFREHFLKHGAETGCRTPKEYIKRANRVIKSPHTQKKREKEDGDIVYFDRASGEIVFCTAKGSIRTYYISDSAYFNRQ